MLWFHPLFIALCLPFNNVARPKTNVDLSVRSDFERLSQSRWEVAVSQTLAWDRERRQRATNTRHLSALACLSLARNRAELGRRLVRGICIDIPGPPTDRPTGLHMAQAAVGPIRGGGQKETSWHSKAPNARPTEVLGFQQAILALLGLLQIVQMRRRGHNSAPSFSSPHHEIFRSLCCLLLCSLSSVMRHPG